MSNGTEREEADMEMRARAAMYTLAKAMKCDDTALEVLAKATNLILAAQSAGFVTGDGQVKLACLNCGAWWNREGKCPLCMNTHAETVAALAASPSQVGRGEGEK